MKPNPISLLIAALWIVMMVLLVRDHVLPHPIGQDAENVAPDEMTDRWRNQRRVMMIRRGDTPIGATALMLTRGEKGQNHRVSQRVILNVGLTQINLQGAALLGPDLELDRFWAQLSSPMMNLSVRGQAVSNELIMAISSPLGERVFRQPIEGEVSVLDAVSTSMFDTIDLVPGNSYRIPTADVFGSMSGGELVIEVQDYELVDTHLGRVPAYRVATQFAGMTSTTWVDESGDVVMQNVWGDIYLDRVGPRELENYTGLRDEVRVPEFDLTEIEAEEATPWSEQSRSLFSMTQFLWGRQE